MHNLIFNTSVRIPNFKFALATGVIFTGVLFSACGKPENNNVPKKVDELTVSDVKELSTTISDKQDKWNALAEYLGIGNNQATDMTNLKKSLATAPLSTTTNYAKLVGLDIPTEIISTAFETQCGQIVGITYLSPTLKLDSTTGAPVNTTVPGKTYLLSYKLLTKSGSVETTARTAIITLPSSITTPVNTTQVPLVMFGHTSDSGLTYTDIVGLMGDLQSTHIIAAPSFPGEAICSETDNLTKKCKTGKELVAAVGTRSIFDGDVKEFLGLQSCINTKLAPPLGAPAKLTDTKDGSEIDNPFVGRLSPHSTNAASQFGLYAKTLAVGADRGGTVAQLAVARSGVILSDLASGSTSKISAMKTAFNTANPSAQIAFYPHNFSVLATVFSPFTYTIGSYRMLLEQAVKGNLSAMTSGFLPGMFDAQDLFKSYRDNALTATTTADAAKMWAVRDMAFLAPFVGIGLRNWTQYYAGVTTVPGTAAIFQGTKDKYVPFEHAQIAFTAYKNVNLALKSDSGSSIAGKGPGFSFLAYAFQAPDANLQACTADLSADLKCLIDPSTQHGDTAFITSQLANSISAEMTTVGAALPAVNLATLTGGILGTAAASSATANALIKDIYSFGAYNSQQVVTKSTVADVLKAEATAPYSVYSGAYTATPLTGATPALTIGVWRATIAKGAIE